MKGQQQLTEALAAIGARLPPVAAPAPAQPAATCTGNLRLARKVAPKGERENELVFIIAAQSILAPYALIWPALLKQPAGEILSPRGQPNLF